MSRHFTNSLHPLCLRFTPSATGLCLHGTVALKGATLKMEINQQVAARTIIPKPVTAVAEPLRVVVVDDSVEFLEVVSGLVELEDSIEVVGKATDGTEAIHAVAELSPDLVLMDVNMPYMNGLTA